MANKYLVKDDILYHILKKGYTVDNRTSKHLICNINSVEVQLNNGLTVQLTKIQNLKRLISFAQDTRYMFHTGVDVFDENNAPVDFLSDDNRIRDEVLIKLFDIIDGVEELSENIIPVCFEELEDEYLR